MKMKYFIFLLPLAPLLVQARAAETFPFVDQNNITGISRVGHQLVLKTTNGQKTFNLKTQEWTYQVSVSAPTPMDSNGIIETKWLPLKWNKIGGYGDAGSVDYISLDSDNKKEYWNLAGRMPLEFGNYSYEALEDSNYKKNFIFPPKNRFVGGLTYQEKAWLASPEGLMSLDLESGLMTWYLTYPLFPVIDYQKAGDRSIFLSSGGVYYLEGSQVVVVPTAPSPDPVLFSGLLIDGNKIYFLSCPIMTKTRFLDFGKEVLDIYDFETHKLETIPLPVRYASHLVKSGTDIIGYGLYREFDDGLGTYDIMEGGAFCFSPRKNRMKKWTDLPIAELNPVTLKAKSLYYYELNYVVVSDLSYSPEKDKLVTTSSERICRECGVEKYSFNKYKKYLNDSKSFNRLANLEGNNWKRLVIKNDFSNLKVLYQTIPQNRGNAKVETNPDRMILEKPIPTSTPTNTPVPTPTVGLIEKWLYH
jgi:hypothetical protein